MPATGSLSSQWCLPPILDDSVRQQVSPTNLLPTNTLLPKFLNDLLNPFNENLIGSLIGGMRFITANMDVRGWRQRGDLAQGILQKLVCDLIVDRKRTGPSLITGVERTCLFIIVQSCIRGQSTIHMSRHVYFWDDDDVMSGGILDNLLIVLLSVEPSGTACKVCGSTVFRQSRPGVDHQ